MARTIILNALYPFYLGYVVQKSAKDDGPVIVEVTCGCFGQPMPGNKYRMELCFIHEASAATP